MRGYGLPRNQDVAYPDCADIQEYGLASRAGHLAGRGGDVRSNFKKSLKKAKVRRGYKRRARAEGKVVCRSEAGER